MCFSHSQSDVFAHLCHDNPTATLRDTAPYNVWETKVVQGYAISNALIDGTIAAKFSLDFSRNCILRHWLVGTDYIPPC